MIYWYTIVIWTMKKFTYLKLKHKLIRDLRDMYNYIYTSKYVCNHVHTHPCLQAIILKISLVLHLGSIKIVTICAVRRSKMKYLLQYITKANNSQHILFCWQLLKFSQNCVCVRHMEYL